MSYLGSEIKRTASNTAVRLRDIPVCRYGLSIYDEKRIYTNKDFLRIYRDMALIREFEIMLLSLQTKEFYRGIRYSLKKSVAVRLGREALSVGEAYCSEPSDDLFSAENNIADLLAKGLSAIEKMTEEELAQIMKGYHGGKVLSPLSEIADKKPAVKDVALSFLLYGTLSEFFGKATGFAYGSRGADVCFTPIGFYSCNGAKTDLAGLAVGAGLYRKNLGTGGCVIANMSADAVFDGKTLEAFCYAESGAFRTNKGAGLPVLFTMVRGRDADESDGAVRKCTSRICAGIGANGMYTEAVNGSDPLAVIDAVSRKKDILKRGDGAALLEAVCDDLRENPKGADPVKLYREKLIRYGIASDSELKKLEEYVSARLEQICRLAADDTKSPPAEHTAEEDLALPDGTPIGTHRKVMPEVKLPPKDCKRWQELQKKKKEPSSYTLGDALAEPILDMLYRDPDFIVCGMNENDGVLGGFSEVAEPNRLLRAFVSEAALVSCAVGYALRGGRAVLSLEGTHSLLSAADILSRQLSQWQSALGGRSIPLVLRVPVDSNQNTATAFAAAQAVPGLKTVYPVTPCDAKGLMEMALREDGPVIFLEPKELYGMTENFSEDGTAKETPIGKPSLVKKGGDLTVLTVGSSLYTAVKASAVLSEAHGVEAEILNARTLVPFDCDPVLSSVEKTGKLLIVGEGPKGGSVMRELAAVLGELAFDLLDAPVTVVGAEGASVPTETDIVRAVHQKIIPLRETAEM